MAAFVVQTCTCTAQLHFDLIAPRGACSMFKVPARGVMLDMLYIMKY